MPRYECLNPTCPNFVRNRVRMERHDLLVDGDGYLRCPACHSYVREAQGPAPSNDGAQALGAAAAGAALGGAMFGPAGALVGGALGLLFASGSAGKS